MKRVMPSLHGVIIFICVMAAALLLVQMRPSALHGFMVQVDDDDDENQSFSSLSTSTPDQRRNAAQTKNRWSNRTYPNIQQISLLGERNSGTRWIFAHLNECFGHELLVVSNLTRHKHWFQFDSDTNNFTTTTTTTTSNQHNEKTDNHMDDSSSILVVAQFRNPYDWLKAMEKVPHHAPNHLRTAAGSTVHSNRAQNDYRIFLTKPWTMPRMGADLELIKNTTFFPDNETLQNAVCQDQQFFRYKDIVSCVPIPIPVSDYNYTLRFSEHEPFYELSQDGSGRPYPTLAALRAAKIWNWLSVARYRTVAAVWVVQYEYVLSQGTAALVAAIEAATGVARASSSSSSVCQVTAPRPIQSLSNTSITRASRILTSEYAAFVRQHAGVEWDAEAMIGYFPNVCLEDEYKSTRECQEMFGSS